MTILPTEPLPVAANGVVLNDGVVRNEAVALEDSAILIRLLQLASPALPVGGFSYSQGLEWAVEQGLIRNATNAADWIRALLDGPVGYADTAFLARFHLAWHAPDAAVLLRLDRLYQTSRESAELLAEARQMGWSLASLCDALPPQHMGSAWQRMQPVLTALRAATGGVSYPLMWSAVTVAAGIGLRPALTAWLWSWLENQVMAALKTVPLGQTAGQALLLELGTLVPAIVEHAVRAAVTGPGLADWDPALDDEDGPGTFAPAYALACTRHETQYSRLFRS